MLTQLTLSQFLREGHYAAHIRRMRLLYGRRRALLSELIVEHLGEDYLGYNSNAGLHLILRLPEATDDVLLSSRIIQRGVMVKPLSSYYLHPRPQRGLLLGYACVKEEDMARAFSVIVSCLKEMRPRAKQA